MMVRKSRKKQEAVGTTGSDAIVSNEDLLTLILLCLPVKSLLRFKSVSKNWRSLITSEHFYDLKSKRLSLSNDISGLLLKRLYRRHHSNPKYEFIPLGEDVDQKSLDPRIRRKSPMARLDFIQTEGTLEILQSCNGLLLCRHEQVRNREYYVINPTSKEYITVPVTRVRDSGWGESALFVNLAFDPRKSPHFKLVCAFHLEYPRKSGDACFSVGIYSSETGVLRTVDACLSGLGREYCRGVYWNGAVVWIDKWVGGGGQYFNVDEERVGTFPRPPMSSDDDEEGTTRYTTYFGESNDHLHLIETSNRPLTAFNVYEMDKGYSGWFVKFRVDLQPVLSLIPESVVLPEAGVVGVAASFGVLGIIRKDGDGKSFLVLSIPNKVIRFDLEDGSFSKLCEFASTNDHVYHWWHSIQYTGSLHRL